MYIFSSDFNDNNLALKNALRLSFLFFFLSVVIVLPLGFFLASKTVFYALLLGILIGSLFVISTIILIVVTSKLSLDLILVIMVLGTFMKIILLFVFMITLKNQDFYNKPVLGLTIIITWLAVFSIEMFAIFKSKQPYIDL